MRAIYKLKRSCSDEKPCSEENRNESGREPFWNKQIVVKLSGITLVAENNRKNKKDNWKKSKYPPPLSHKTAKGLRYVLHNIVKIYSNILVQVLDSFYRNKKIVCKLLCTCSKKCAYRRNEVYRHDEYIQKKDIYWKVYINQMSLKISGFSKRYVSRRFWNCWRDLVTFFVFSEFSFSIYLIEFGRRFHRWVAR